jgi:transposase-like protein
MNSKPLSTCEFITVEEVGKRLDVCRATLFNWMQQGVFIQGKHFFKRGRVLRFIWRDDLVNAVMGESLEKSENTAVAKPAQVKKTSPLNWEY